MHTLVQYSVLIQVGDSQHLISGLIDLQSAGLPLMSHERYHKSSSRAATGRHPLSYDVGGFEGAELSNHI